MPASGKAADSGLINDRLAAVNTSLGLKVRFDAAQTLTEAQKAQALANIGAAAAGASSTDTVASVEAFMSARTGTTNGTTGSTLTYGSLYSTTFPDSSGWSVTAPSTIASGDANVTGDYMAGQIEHRISGVTPGRRYRATWTFNASSTGWVMGYLDPISIDAGTWTWLDGGDYVPANGRKTFGRVESGSTAVFEVTAPSGTTDLLVGLKSAYGTAIFADLVVEMSAESPSVGLVSDPDTTMPIPLNKAHPYKVDVSAAPLDPDSATVTASLVQEINDNAPNAVAANIYQWSTALWRVTNATPAVDWTYNNEMNWTWTPTEMFDGRAYLKGVRTPASLATGGGDDRSLAIYNTDTGELRETWKNLKTGSTWGAQQGWKIPDVRVWDGTYPQFGTAVAASGLSHVCMNITVADIQSGTIEHAMQLQLNRIRWSNRPDAFVRPAVRNTDGAQTENSASYVPYGARFRIKASATMPSGLHPIAQKVWTAAKKYGFIVGDAAGNVAVSFDGDDQYRADTGTDRWATLLNGTQPYNLFTGFPWSDLELVQEGWKP